MSVTLNKWDILDSPEVAWQPHAAQEEIVSSSARFRVVSAGRRFGKSDVGGHELIPEFFLAYTMREALADALKRREFWIVGPEYSDAEKEFRVIYNSLKKLGVQFDRPGTYYNADSGQLDLSCNDGTFQVHGKSAKYPGTLVGEGLAGVILAEAAKLKKSVWTKYIQPTLADYKGWAILTSTPEGKNWFHECFEYGQDLRMSDWASWKFPAWVNHYVYKQPTKKRDVIKILDILKLPNHPSQETIGKMFTVDPEILSRLMSMTEETFLQEIAAEFTDFVGKVFKNFDEDYHFSDNVKYNPDWKTVAFVDYGYTNPNVWLLAQIGHWGEINILDELYEPGLTPLEFATEIKARGLAPASLTTFYPDPASPGSTRQLEQTLGVRHTSSADRGDDGKKERIDAIRLALKPRLTHVAADHPDNRARLMFSNKCIHCKYEFENYRYPEARNEQEAPELPMKKDDHTPEAIGRYFAATGTPAEEAQATRQTTANMRG